MSRMPRMKLDAIGSVSTAPVSRRAELDAVVRPGPTGRPMGINSGPTETKPNRWTKGVKLPDRPVLQRLSGHLIASVQGLEQLGRSSQLATPYSVLWRPTHLVSRPTGRMLSLRVPLIVVLPISPRNPGPPLRTDAVPAAAMADCGPTDPAAAASSPPRVSDPQPGTEEAPAAEAPDEQTLVQLPYTWLA